jgi:hypothetical protein
MTMLPEDFPGDTPEKKVFHWKQWLVDIRKRVPDMDDDAIANIRAALEDRQTRTRLPDEAIELLAEFRDRELGLGRYSSR